MIFQIVSNLVRYPFQETCAWQLFAVFFIHFPNQMKVIRHDHVSIHCNELTSHQILQTADDNLFVFIRFKQMFPSMESLLSKNTPPPVVWLIFFDLNASCNDMMDWCGHQPKFRFNLFIDSLFRERCGADTNSVAGVRTRHLIH